jgi:hypothetical protein
MSSFNEIYGELKWRARARLDVHRREKPNDVLLIAAVIQLALMIAMVVAAAFDTRLVSGVNPWFKPIKFTQSIAAYVLTVAWMLDYLHVSRRGKQIISWGIAICVVTQITGITLQAARGTRSHFNLSSPFDVVITVLLDVMDLVNTGFVIALLVFACQGKYAVGRPTQWGIATGLLIFLGASAIGGVMVFKGGHSVGVVSGDSGLPFLDWSLKGGDLRPAHFLGLHALQILPIAGWLINQWVDRPVWMKLAGVLATAVLVAGVVAFLFVQAMTGVPFVRGADHATDLSRTPSACNSASLWIR